MCVRWMLVGVALLAAGCELHLGVEAAFDRDGSGHLEVAVSADEELRARAAAAGADPLEDLAAAGEKLGDGWRVSDTATEGGARTVALSTGFGGPDEFNALAADLAGALSSPEAELLSPLKLTVAEDRLRVDGAAALQPTDAVHEHGLTPMEVVEALQREGEVTYQLRVVLPGEVLDTNAHHREEDALAWTIAPGERVDIHALARRPDPPVWPWAVGGVVALLVAVLAVLAVRRSWRRSGRHTTR